VTGLGVGGFNFTADDVAAMREAFSDAGPCALLSTLTFTRCIISDPVHGFCSLATAMSPSGSLRSFNLEHSPVQISDMAALCSVLTRSEWPLTKLFLGDTPHVNNERYLSDACVKHFFQLLPSIRTLTNLEFRRTVPAHLSRTVLDGIKNNYWLQHVTGLTFGTKRLRSEAKSYTSANAKGRTAVYEAVANPGSRRLLDAAIAALHRLSSSDDREDATALFLCVQVLLPCCGGRRGVSRAGTRR
jgi:hypothetical protein